MKSSHTKLWYCALHYFLNSSQCFDTHTSSTCPRAQQCCTLVIEENRHLLLHSPSILICRYLCWQVQFDNRNWRGVHRPPSAHESRLRVHPSTPGPCWHQLTMLPEVGWHVSWSRRRSRCRKCRKMQIDLSWFVTFASFALLIALCIWWVIAPSLCSEARRELAFLDAKQAVSSTFACGTL